MSYINDLKEKGYAVIENVLDEIEIEKAIGYFRDWVKHPDIKSKHSKISPHGIFKHFEVGHQKHAWFIRTREKVIDKFQKLWNTKELNVSFDGTCYIKKEEKKKDSIWTHTDQAPISIGLQCYQGFVSLTDNEDRTLVVYEGSHLLHENYMKEKNLKHKKNWEKIDKDYLNTISNRKKVVSVKAGSLVLWDSRTFHQNQYGIKKEERIVQYVSYLPKTHIKNTKTMQKKRLKYFNERRTTSHWASPLIVNGKQPRTYGNNNLLIDYSKLNIVDLKEFEEEIKKLL